MQVRVRLYLYYSCSCVCLTKQPAIFLTFIIILLYNTIIYTAENFHGSGYRGMARHVCG